VVSEIEECLAGGATLAEIAKTLGLKLNTVQKAMREGRIRAPVDRDGFGVGEGRGVGSCRASITA
jgi:hypothetical protein